MELTHSMPLIMFLFLCVKKFFYLILWGERERISLLRWTKNRLICHQNISLIVLAVVINLHFIITRWFRHHLSSVCKSRSTILLILNLDYDNQKFFSLDSIHPLIYKKNVLIWIKTSVKEYKGLHIKVHNSTITMWNIMNSLTARWSLTGCLFTMQ